MSEIANTPEPPYYAVIFTSHKTNKDNGYGEMADRMVELALKQPGFLGIESARESVGITVSYWTDLESINVGNITLNILLPKKKVKISGIQNLKHG